MPDTFIREKSSGKLMEGPEGRELLIMIYMSFHSRSLKV